MMDADVEPSPALLRSPLVARSSNVTELPVKPTRLPPSQPTRAELDALVKAIDEQQETIAALVKRIGELERAFDALPLFSREARPADVKERAAAYMRDYRRRKKAGT